MEKQSVIHSTFVIERQYPAPPQRVFAAFSDATRKRRWFVEGLHHDVERYSMDFKVGGKESATFRFRAGTPVQGMTCVNDTAYLDIIPDNRIVFASTMTLADKHISASLGTLEFLPSEKGTCLLFTHQAAFFEGADGPEMREAGWRSLFEKLELECADLVKG